MADPWRYRNKMEYSFGERDGAPGARAAPPRLVARRRRGRGLPPGAVEMARARQAVATACRALALPVYSAATHTAACCATWSCASGRASGELLLNLFVTERFRQEQELADRVAADQPFTSFAVTVNETRADAAIGVGPFMVAGPPHFHEELAGVRLRVPALAFLQTNSEMCGVLYETALRCARPEAGRSAYDLYCGIGGAQPAARARSGRSCTASRSRTRPSPRPPRTRVSNGARQRRLHRRRRARRCCSTRRRGATPRSRGSSLPTASLISRCARRRAPFEPPAVVVTDPPRAGMAKKAVERMALLGADRIVYVSCNPTTLAANAAQLADARLPARHGHAGRHVPAHPPHRGGRALRQGGDRRRRRPADRQRLRDQVGVGGQEGRPRAAAAPAAPATRAPARP